MFKYFDFETGILSYLDADLMHSMSMIVDPKELITILKEQPKKSDDAKTFFLSSCHF